MSATARLVCAIAAFAASVGPVAAQAPGAIALAGAGPFEAYAHAIASLAIWSLLTIALIPLSVAGAARGRTQSGLPVRDYTDPMYRRHRALQNSMEVTGPFLAATVAAILAGASPFWVNLLVSVFVLARIATAVVHVATEIQWLRSATWAVGMLCLSVLTVIAVIAAFAP
jgi:uncharacterized MAPEG superfamily protein